MDIPGSGWFTRFSGRSTADQAGSPDERSKVMDGGQLIVEGEEAISIDIPEDSDVDPDQIQAALEGRAGDVRIQGQTGGETTVTPVASGSDIHITDSAFDLSNWEYEAHLDDKITNILDNSVDYNQQTGQWMLANDDLIPGILIRLESLLLGEDGLTVEPEDPDAEADQRLAEHMESVYSGDADTEAHVRPTRVVNRILEQNAMNAVWVGRSVDLQHLDVDDLSYVKDGETGEEIYIQQPTSYSTFEVDDEGRPEIGVEHTDDPQALEIGEEVVDVRLYRTPPLQAVADDVTNKLQLKRLMGRKAELASIGGVIIKVNPPAWLDEEDYGNYIRSEDDEFSDQDGRLLELVMAQQIDAALDTLESYQTATVMSIPENWEIETVDLPEMDESMGSMIRSHNEAIARRLLLPLDLLELEKGSELSRNSMMSMFMNMISGWQGDIVEMFDQFAQIQKDIHGMAGAVSHRLPSISAEDETEIVQLLNFAGLLGLSEAESRELANTLEGVDLDTEQMDGLPPEGGPDDVDQRNQQIDEFLEDQGPEGQDSGPNPQGSPGQEQVQQAQAALAGADQAVQATQDGDPICWVCGSDAGLVNRTPPYEYACSHHGISPNHVPIGAADIQAQNIPGVDDPHVGFQTLPEGWDRSSVIDAWTSLGGTWRSCFADMSTKKGPRFARRFCSALKDEFLGTERWRKGSGAAAVIEAASVQADSTSFSVQFDGSLDDLADQIRDVISQNVDADVSTRASEDDYVLLEAGDEQISIAAVDDGEFAIAGATKSDQIFDGLEGVIEAARPIPMAAAHGFSGFETLREAAAHVRDVVERQTPEGHTTEMRKPHPERWAVMIRDRQGNFQGSMIIREDRTDEDEYVIIGGQDFFG